MRTVSGSGSLWNNYSTSLGIRGCVSVPARIYSNGYFTNENSCWSFTLLRPPSLVICIYLLFNKAMNKGNKCQGELTIAPVNWRRVWCSLIDVCLNILINLLLLSVYLIIKLKVNTNLHLHWSKQTVIAGALFNCFLIGFRCISAIESSTLGYPFVTSL